MKEPSLDQISRARQFFAAKSVHECWMLPWMYRRTRYTSFSGEGAVDSYVQRGDLMLAKYLSKAAFDPDMTKTIPLETSCIKNYSDQVPE